MSERIRGSYYDALYKSTYTLLYFTSTNGAVKRIDDAFGPSCIL